DVVVAPVLLTVPYWWNARAFASRATEAAALAAVTVALSVLVFLVPPTPVFSHHQLEFVVFPVVIWAGLRVAHPGAALISTFISFVAVWGTLRGGGPFGGPSIPSLQENVILLQMFTAVIASTGLACGAAIADRKRSEHLRQADHAIAAILADAHDV